MCSTETTTSRRCGINPYHRARRPHADAATATLRAIANLQALGPSLGRKCNEEKEKAHKAKHTLGSSGSNIYHRWANISTFANLDSALSDVFFPAAVLEIVQPPTP